MNLGMNEWGESILIRISRALAENRPGVLTAPKILLYNCTQSARPYLPLNNREVVIVSEVWEWYARADSNRRPFAPEA